jgi:hypothetical protein
LCVIVNHCHRVKIHLQLINITLHYIHNEYGVDVNRTKVNGIHRTLTVDTDIRSRFWVLEGLAKTTKINTAFGVQEHLLKGRQVILTIILVVHFLSTHKLSETGSLPYSDVKE